jgi:hypothetical protein
LAFKRLGVTEFNDVSGVEVDEIFLDCSKSYIVAAGDGAVNDHGISRGYSWQE